MGTKADVGRLLWFSEFGGSGRLSLGCAPLVMACIASANAPLRSLRLAMVSPAPLAPARVRERIRIQSPSGGRKKYWAALATATMTAEVM